MKRKKDRSGSVALAATAIVIILAGVSLFSVYSLAKRGYINLPFNLSAQATDAAGTGVPAGAEEAAEDIVRAVPMDKEAGQVAAGPSSDSPLKITGVIDLNSRTPSYDIQSAQDTAEEPVQEEPVKEESAKEEPAVQEPVNKELSAEPAQEEAAAPEPAQGITVYEEPVYTEPLYSEPEEIVYADFNDTEDVQIPELSAAEEYAATHLGMDYSDPVNEEYEDYEEEYVAPAFAYAPEEDLQDLNEEEPYEEESFDEEPVEEAYYEEFDEEISYEEVVEEIYYAGPSEESEDYYEEESYEEEPYYEEESYEDYNEEESYYEESGEEYYEDEEYYEESYEEASYGSYWWDESLYDIWTDDAGTWIHNRETGEIFNSEIGPDPNYLSYNGSDDDWYEETYEEEDWSEESYEEDWSEESYEEDYGTDYWSDPRYEVWTDDAGVWIVDTETGETFNAEVGPDPNYGSEEEDYYEEESYEEASWEDNSGSYMEEDYDDYEDEDYDDYEDEDYDDSEEEDYDDYEDEDYDDSEDDYYEEIYYTLGEQIVDYALGFVGVTPYVWGGNSLYGGTDCSGFVHLIFADFGIYCSHASLDYNGGSFGYLISYDELQPGDIVVYGGGDHVAIYAGNGYVVHCSSPENGTVYWNMNYRSDISWFLRVIY